MSGSPLRGALAARLLDDRLEPGAEVELEVDLVAVDGASAEAFAQALATLATRGRRLARPAVVVMDGPLLDPGADAAAARAFVTAVAGAVGLELVAPGQATAAAHVAGRRGLEGAVVAGTGDAPRLAGAGGALPFAVGPLEAAAIALGRPLATVVPALRAVRLVGSLALPTEPFDVGAALAAGRAGAHVALSGGGGLTADGRRAVCAGAAAGGAAAVWVTGLGADETELDLAAVEPAPAPGGDRLAVGARFGATPDDLHAAADALTGRSLAPHVALFVVPDVARSAAGTAATELRAAGARVLEPGAVVPEAVACAPRRAVDSAVAAAARPPDTATPHPLVAPGPLPASLAAEVVAVLGDDGRVPDLLPPAVGDEAQVLVGGARFGGAEPDDATAAALVRAGVRAIVADSFGDGFRRSLVAHGVLPLTFGADAARGRVQPGDHWTLHGLEELGGELLAVNDRVPQVLRLRADLRPGELAVARAGGFLGLAAGG